MKEYFEKIENIEQEKFYEKVKNKIIKQEKMFIITANPETLMFADKDKEFKEIVMNKETTLVADGIGVLKGAKMLNINLEHRILGVDLSIKLLEYCNELKKSIYLFGASIEVIEKLKQIIQSRYSNVNICGATDGYIENKESVFNDIKQKKPDVILVALGVPAQEKLIAKFYKEFSKGIFVGVGGSFDVISETKKRAPKIFIKLNLEWLYRITTEPKRLKRFYNSNIKFVFKIMKEKKK